MLFSYPKTVMVEETNLFVSGKGLFLSIKTDYIYAGCPLKSCFIFLMQISNHLKVLFSYLN